MKKLTIIIGKMARVATRLRGGGSALPGLIVERLNPGFLAQVLSGLPRGVVVISGTNGKTTTTKILVELLESHNVKVFTNKTGSNFTRGIISELLGEIRGFKLDADIAVLELDEAYAVHFVRQIAPNYCLLLNVLRDQLDRFGDVTKVASLLGDVARAATDGAVLNRDNPPVANLASDVTVPVKFFGHSSRLADQFPNDTGISFLGPKRHTADVMLMSFDKNHATYKIGSQTYPTTLRLSGAHNALNAAAALAMARMILGDKANSKKLVAALSHVKPAFGRGETIAVNGQNLDLVLVKNASGFRSALTSQFNLTADVMIAINDYYADGRDISWLDDVNFTTLNNVSVVSGTRAMDMAKYLSNNNVSYGTVESDLKKALARFLKTNNRSKQIFCSYTAMMELRKQLGKIAKIDKAL